MKNIYLYILALFLILNVSVLGQFSNKNRISQAPKTVRKKTGTSLNYNTRYPKYFWSASAGKDVTLKRGRFMSSLRSQKRSFSSQRSGIKVRSGYLGELSAEKRRFPKNSVNSKSKDALAKQKKRGRFYNAGISGDNQKSFNLFRKKNKGGNPNSSHKFYKPLRSKKPKNGLFQYK